MNLETKITIYKFTPQVFTLTPIFFILKLHFLIYFPIIPDYSEKSRNFAIR